MDFQDGTFYSQSDPELIKIISEKYLIPPSSNSYNLKDPKKENSMGQAQKIISILKNQVTPEQGTFFISTQQ